MDISSRFTEQSNSLSGVSFTVRRLNSIQRAHREAVIIESREQLAEILKQYADLADGDPGKARLDREYGVIHARYIKPAVILAGLVRVDGLTADGKPVTDAEALLELGADADALIDEIYIACERGSGLTVAQKNESSSGGTSTDAEQAPSTSTTA